jgi:hypothetical protein
MMMHCLKKKKDTPRVTHVREGDKHKISYLALRVDEIEQLMQVRGRKSLAHLAFSIFVLNQKKKIEKIRPSILVSLSDS